MSEAVYMKGPLNKLGVSALSATVFMEFHLTNDMIAE